MDDSATLLAIGDVHLGTRCSGVPGTVLDWGIDPGDLTPAAALELCVEHAVRERVDAVLFAGDVVESTNARFEAMRPLESCVRRLLDAGIEVIAVAGNHDVEALPRLASLVDGFRLLGAGGTWESRILTKDRVPVAEIVGWSFGEQHVRQSPVAELLNRPLLRTALNVPRIGLLHADLDASGGHYAPIRRTELDDTGYDVWLLGHIHKPTLAQDPDRPSGYLGSLAALDPSETGAHGPWLIRFGQDGAPGLRQVPLSPVRWEHVAIAIDGLEHAEDVADRLLSEAADIRHRIAREGPLPRVLGLRARLTGASPCHAEVKQRIAAGEWADLGRLVDGTAVFFERIVADMTPRLDLVRIARGDDPAALLARRLLILGEDGDEARVLLDEARAALSAIARHEHWRPVGDHRNATDPLADGPLRDMLVRSGMMALDAMLASTEEGGPS